MILIKERMKKKAYLTPEMTNRKVFGKYDILIGMNGGSGGAAGPGQGAKKRGDIEEDADFWSSSSAQ